METPRMPNNYEYKIIELGTSEYPKFDFNVCKAFNDPSWFVVEYRSNSKIWHRLTYNMERYLRYRDSYIFKEESRPHICEKDSCWKVGPYIPSYELAQKLMEEHKKKMSKPEKKRRVVYNTSSDNEPVENENESEIGKLINKFNQLLKK